MEAVGDRVVAEQVPSAGLQPPLAVLERQVQRVPRCDFDRAEGLAARRDGEADVERQPRLAALRGAREDAQALGEDTGDGVAQWTSAEAAEVAAVADPAE